MSRLLLDFDLSSSWVSADLAALASVSLVCDAFGAYFLFPPFSSEPVLCFLLLDLSFGAVGLLPVLEASGVVRMSSSSEP